MTAPCVPVCSRAGRPLVHCLTPAEEGSTPATGSKPAVDRYTCPYLQHQAAAAKPVTPV